MSNGTLDTAAAQPLIPALAPLWRHFEPIAYFIVRCATGAIFATHGAARFRIIDIGGPTIESTAKFNAAFGIEPSLLWSYYITSLELAGGILLILGLLTRPVAILLTGFLLVATIYVTPHFGFWARENGFEYSLVLLLLVIYILARGGGPLSLDRRLGKEV
jgi:putative oxidoreductase